MKTPQLVYQGKEIKPGYYGTDATFYVYYSRKRNRWETEREDGKVFALVNSEHCSLDKDEFSVSLLLNHNRFAYCPDKPTPLNEIKRRLDAAEQLAGFIRRHTSTLKLEMAEARARKVSQLSS